MCSLPYVSAFLLVLMPTYPSACCGVLAIADLRGLDQCGAHVTVVTYDGTVALSTSTSTASVRRFLASTNTLFRHSEHQRSRCL